MLYPFDMDNFAYALDGMFCVNPVFELMIMSPVWSRGPHTQRSIDRAMFCCYHSPGRPAVRTGRGMPTSLGYKPATFNKRQLRGTRGGNSSEQSEDEREINCALRSNDSTPRRPTSGIGSPSNRIIAAVPSPLADRASTAVVDVTKPTTTTVGVTNGTVSRRGWSCGR